MAQRCVKDMAFAEGAGRHHWFVAAGSASLRITERAHQDLVLRTFGMHEAVVELVWMHHQVVHAEGDRVVVVDDHHIERMVATVARALAPQQADHLLILGPAVERVVGGVDDGDPAALPHRLQERGVGLLAPARPIVVEHDQVEFSVGVQLCNVLQILRWLVGDGHGKPACFGQRTGDRRTGPSPIVVVGARDQQRLDWRLLARALLDRVLMDRVLLQ